jgi:membrane protein YqaA with SNARE-associated domain
VPPNRTAPALRGGARRPSLRVLLIAAGILTLAASVGAAFAPILVTHAPLWLLALSPLYRHMVLVATLVDFVPFLLVALPARMLGSLLGYLMGAGYGEQSIAWMQVRAPRMGRFVRMLERWFERAAPLLLLAWPGPLFCALAGAGGMSRWLFAVLAVLGQTLQVAIAYRLGEELAPWLTPIVAFLRDYMLPTTLVCVLLVLLYHWWRRPRGNDALDPMSERTGER